MGNCGRKLAAPLIAHYINGAIDTRGRKRAETELLIMAHTASRRPSINGPVTIALQTLDNWKGEHREIYPAQRCYSSLYNEHNREISTADWIIIYCHENSTVFDAVSDDIALTVRKLKCEYKFVIVIISNESALLIFIDSLKTYNLQLFIKYFLKCPQN